MIKQKHAKTLLGGAALSLVLAAAPLHAESHAEMDEADEAAMAVENEAEAMGEKIEDGAEAMGEKAEAMGEDIEEGAEGAAAAVADAVDDDAVAEKLQQDIGAHPQLGVYTIDVTEIDGRYSVNGMIDKSEDYATLEEMLGNVEGVDPSMIDNNVVLN